MDEQGISRAALIPRVTENVVSDKSPLMLTVQRVMMNSNILRPITAGVSSTFYDAQGNLRALWQMFTSSKGDYVKYTGTDNQSVANALREMPDRFWGWIFLNPKKNPKVLDELEKWRGVKGMIGVKVHPYWHQYPMTELSAVAKRVEELGLPILVHLGFGAQGDFKWLAEHFSRLKHNILALRSSFFKAMWPQVKERCNTYMDISSDHLSERFVRHAVDVVGADKCLYGTDSPYGFTMEDGSYNYGEIMDWVSNLPVSERDRSKILGENFLELITV